MLFLSLMICVKLSTMEDRKDNQTLVHPGLLSSKMEFDQLQICPKEASLADCLRDNHHVHIYTTNSSNETVLEFTTYGNDALQWIMPKNNNDQNVINQKWDELKDALHILISQWKITKIIFKIQPEIQRLQKVNRYSCLLDIEHVILADHVMRKLNISNIKIEYLPDETFYTRKSYFLYHKNYKISPSEKVIIDKSIKIETLGDWGDEEANFLMTQASEAQNNVDKEKSNAFSYVLYGGGACFIMLLGLYMYNKMFH